MRLLSLFVGELGEVRSERLDGEPGQPSAEEAGTPGISQDVLAKRVLAHPEGLSSLGDGQREARRFVAHRTACPDPHTPQEAGQVVQAGQDDEATTS